jgi:hypothetical protein
MDQKKKSTRRTGALDDMPATRRGITGKEKSTLRIHYAVNDGYLTGSIRERPAPAFHSVGGDRRDPIAWAAIFLCVIFFLYLRPSSGI